MMSNYILEYLRSKFTPATTTELAQMLNESPASVQKAMDGLIPGVTAGVINRANQSDGITLIHNLLNDAKFDTDSIEQLVETDDERRKAAESGNEFLTRLHGGQVGKFVDETAAYSGVKTASASTMTGLVTSVLMGYLHNQLRTKNMTQPQLATMLLGEAEGVRPAVPAALGVAVAWLSGLGQTRATTVPVTPVATTTTTTVRTHDDDDNKGGGWWKWLLLALGLLGLFLLLTRMCNRDETETSDVRDGAVVTTDSSETVASDTNGNAGTGATAGGPDVRVAVDLPGGRKLNVAENSFNYSLAKFLAVKGGQVPKVFTFDNLTFESNSARITAEARPNVDDLIQIMQAYPSLNIRIEGHTDSTGPEDINDPLSAERADAVKAELVKAGIDAGRVTTRERGESKPVATNETEAGREKNRRIDVVVTKL